MRASLDRWIADADLQRHLEDFTVEGSGIEVATIRSRADDFYLALVGELFDRMRNDSPPGDEWARLGNALGQFGVGQRSEGIRQRIDSNEALLFASAAFYCGGFPASAHVTMREGASAGASEEYRACFDLLARPPRTASELVPSLLAALRGADSHAVTALAAGVTRRANEALQVGPSEWIPARLLERLVTRFRVTNIRAVLPDGYSDSWTPLVKSFMDRSTPTWDFFPSQIQAIRQGLLERAETFSLQMPTGAGKTTLCETLLYWHARSNPHGVGLLLVPYRSLASELRNSVVRRLNDVGVLARCAYGGTVPRRDEVRTLEGTQVLVATPEALSGVLSADADFFRRISLVICDEGHLLDSGARGVGLELLLARMKAREGGAPRFVFVSAIVPNIEEINSWLGGSPDSVVRSDYRPALAEFSMLKPARQGTTLRVDLVMHPHLATPARVEVAGFLQRRDFQWPGANGRPRTYAFNTVKTQSIAAARKALRMGSAAVFAANKRGRQGAVGLSEELLKQLEHPLPLPVPLDCARSEELNAAVDYLSREYGEEWVATRALAAGAVLHHGDIPQETREVVEALIRKGSVRLAICTNTLAEGVNLPIRTLVLYSVKRRQPSGRAWDMLSRDIKNLVGRAGRAGVTTRGLVICANERQWPLVSRVAMEVVGESVSGALRRLIVGLRNALVAQSVTLDNAILEGEEQLQTLVDGVDATLIDLIAEEIGEDAFVRVAVALADQTFAASRADESSKRLLQDVFELRARRVLGIRDAGRIGWIRETGARPRMLDAVERGLLPLRPSWDDLRGPVDSELVRTMFDWAWLQSEFQETVKEAYRIGDAAETTPVRQELFELVTMWLEGRRFVEMAVRSGSSVDDLLGVHSKAIGFVLQTLVEQGVALLARLLASQGRPLSPFVVAFPEHLRFGVPNAGALSLASAGVRHRRAAIALAEDLEGSIRGVDGARVVEVARERLVSDEEAWQQRLGILVYRNTVEDLRAERQA